MAPTCNEVEYLIIRSYMYAIYGIFLGYEVTVVSDLIPSLECMSSINEIYGEGYYGDSLIEYSPESFLFGGIEYIEVRKRSEVKINILHFYS